MVRKPNLGKAIGLLITINGLQILAFLGLGLFSLLVMDKSLLATVGMQIGLVGIVVVSSGVNGIISWRLKVIITQRQRQTTMLEETITAADALNHQLRAQRHDFLNHLQVVFGLIEMDEYQEARLYIEKTYTDIQMVSQNLRTGNIAINALLQAKSASASKHGIDMVMDITSRIENLPIPAWEMCRVLGNLIDNAIEAVQANTQVKTIKIGIAEDIKQFTFTVADNGAGIPKELHEKIFQDGFSTKVKHDGHGEGMGLSITRDILASYQGEIQLDLSTPETTFVVTIPKRSV